MESGLKTYAPTRFSKARVWWCSDPFDGSPRTDSVAVEVWIPRGPRVEYALLGASLERNVSGVQVKCPQDDGAWGDSLASKTDDVRRGLPAEYAESVRQAGETAVAAQSLQHGIGYDRAAHGAIGSSPELFGRLAVALVTILSDPEKYSEEDRVLEIFQRVCGA